MIKKIKLGLAVCGLSLTVLAINGVSVSSAGVSYHAKEGEMIQMQESQGYVFFNLALAALAGSASLKTLLDEENWKSEN